MTEPVLQVLSIAKAFGGIQALAGVTLAAHAGQVHALVGANGAGKSTLIKILTGGEQADDGEIVIDGTPFGPSSRFHERLTPALAQSHGVAAIYQEFNLLPYLSIAENVFLGHLPSARFGFTSPGSAQEQAKAILERLGLNLDPRIRAGRLSVAQQQLLEVAKALALDCRLLLMDEPTAVLGGRSLDLLFRAVEELRSAGVAVVYISHRLDEVFDIADSVTVLKDGRVVGSGRVSDFSKGDLVRLMVGRQDADHQFPPRRGSLGNTALSVRDLSVGSAEAVPVDLDVAAGEIVGLGGFVGSGRTRLLRAIFGLTPHRGSVVVGASARPKSPAAAISSGVGFTPEDRKREGLFLGKSLLFNMTLPILGSLTSLGFIRRADERWVGSRLLAELDIKATSLDQKAGHLSGGNQQKVVLAKWLGAAPKVLLMDEPTRGIDVGAKLQVYHLMRDLADQGIAILMASSEMSELIGMCDRILVMRDGQIAGELDASTCTEEDVLAVSTGLDET